MSIELNSCHHTPPEWLRVALLGVGDAVIIAARNGEITFINSTAQSLTGWSEVEALGLSLEQVFSITGAGEGAPDPTRVRRVNEHGASVHEMEPVLLLSRLGREIPIERKVISIRDLVGNEVGSVVIFRDLSDRKRAESTQRQLASIVESSDDAIIGKTLDGTITSWNKGAEKIYGYTAREVVGRSMSVITPPDRVDEIQLILGRIAQGEQIEHFETLRKRKDGSLVNISLTISPIRDERGRIIGASKIARNITAQKVAERQLRESVERFTKAFNASPLSLTVTSLKDERLMEVNDTFVRMSGYSRDESIGKTTAQLKLWSNLDDRTEELDQVRREGRVKEARYSFKTRDGSELIGLLSAEQIDIAGEPCALTVIQDITQRTRSEERQRLLWEAAGILLTSDTPASMLKGIFSVIGRQFSLDFFLNYMVNQTGDGLRLESFIGLDQTEAERMSKLDMGQGVSGTVAETRRAIVLGSIDLETSTLGAVLKEYGIRSYACNPLLAGEKLIGTLSFASRSRNSFTPTELEFFETISRYITVAYERLSLIDRLKEADRRKDEFLAMLAHELRNPLAPIRNAVEIFKRSHVAAPELEWPKEVMDRQVGHMTRLVDDLLDVSRITRGKIELRKEILSIRTIIERALEASRPLVDSRRQRLTAHFPPEVLSVEGDATRLAQVFSNLVNNASKYTDDGGQIELTVNKVGDEVVTCVRDNGIGIPPDTLPHVFDLFAQAERSIDRAQGGLGIGLTVVRGIVEMHGGSVEASSEGLGKGSKFVVRLNASSPPVAAIIEDSEPEANLKVSTGCRILVVDDNVDSAESLSLLLQFDGHEVKAVFEGQSAVAIIGEFNPNVILLDIGLPGMNGYEVARAIRADPKNKGIVLIALTGYGQAEDRKRSRDSGFDHHLTKPVDHELLASLLESMLPDKG